MAFFSGIEYLQKRTLLETPVVQVKKRLQKSTQTPNVQSRNSRVECFENVRVDVYFLKRVCDIDGFSSALGRTVSGSYKRLFREKKTYYFYCVSL